MDPDDANDASWSTMSETSTSNTTASELEGACAMLLNEEAEDTLHLKKAVEDTLHREEAKDTLHLQKAAEDTLHREGMEDTTHLQKAAEDTLFRQEEVGQTLHLNKAAQAVKPTQERGRTRHRRVRALSDGAKRMWESHRFQKNMADRYLDQVVDVQGRLEREFDTVRAIRNAIPTDESQVLFREERNKVLLNMMRLTERGSPEGPRLVKKGDMKNIYGPGHGGPQLVHATGEKPMSNVDGISNLIEMSSTQEEEMLKRKFTLVRDKSRLKKQKVLVDMLRVLRKNMEDTEQSEVTGDVIAEMRDDIHAQQVRVDNVQQELEHCEHIASQYNPLVTVPDVYEYTVWDDLTVDKLRPENLLATVQPFDPRADPKMDFDDTWRQVLMHTKHMKLDEGTYKRILTMVLLNEASQTLYELSAAGEPLNSIIQGLTDLYSKRTTIVDDINELNNFKRRPNENIHTCMRRAMAMANKVRHICSAEVWESTKRKEILLSIIRQVVTAETRRQIEFEELKFLKCGTQMTYKAILDLVDTFETTNGQIPQYERELTVNVTSGAPKVVEPDTPKKPSYRDVLCGTSTSSASKKESDLDKLLKQTSKALKNCGIEISDADGQTRFVDHRSSSEFKKKSREGGSRDRSSTQSAATSLEYEPPQDNPPERTLEDEGNRWNGNNQRPWKPRGNGRGRGGYRGNYRGNWRTHDGGNWSEQEHFPSWYDQPLQSWSPPSIDRIPEYPPVRKDFNPEVIARTLEGYEGHVMCRQCNTLHKVNSYCPINGQKVTPLDGDKIYSLNYNDL
jgi:hypothetical protein